ncbi:MAG: hypothetical protein WD942_03030 [Dehalococcoidia bacterium]
MTATPLNTPPADDIQRAGVPWIVRDLRMLAAAATAGLVVGFVVNGWGSRLAMMLLARLNPDATGRISDDGFRIGQFGLGDTLSLVLFATAVGVLGGLVFLAVRGLRFRPPWFRVVSMTVGPAVVVGAMLVHTDGVDFRILRPVWLAIALFVALPALYAYAVMRIADRWLREDSWFLRGGRGWWIGLAPLVLAAPALPLLAVGAMARITYQSAPTVRRLLPPRVATTAARLALVGVFLVAAGDLLRDSVVLL